MAKLTVGNVLSSEVLLHGHHEGLLTWGRGYEERLREIRRVKPASELPTRERVMRVLTEAELGALPPDVLQAGWAWDAAERKYYAASQALDAARQAYDNSDQAWDAAERKPEEAWQALYDTCYETWRAYYEVQRANKAQVNAWHKKVCRCPARAANQFNIFGDGAY